MGFRYRIVSSMYQFSCEVLPGAPSLFPWDVHESFKRENREILENGKKWILNGVANYDKMEYSMNGIMLYQSVLPFCKRSIPSCHN